MIIINNNIYSSIALISSSTGTCSVRCIKLHIDGEIPKASNSKFLKNQF